MNERECSPIGHSEYIWLISENNNIDYDTARDNIIMYERECSPIGHSQYFRLIGEITILPMMLQETLL